MAKGFSTANSPFTLAVTPVDPILVEEGTLTVVPDFPVYDFATVGVDATGVTVFVAPIGGVCAVTTVFRVVLSEGKC